MRTTRGGTLTAALASVQLAPYSSSGVRYQIQHKNEQLQTHGFGLIKHGPATSKDSGTVPAADLAHTSVQYGFGTSAADPYIRTLPNLELRPPETTVVDRDGASMCPNVDEIATLSSRREGLRYWIGGEYPRLPLWLKALKSPSALPVTSNMQPLLDEFAANVLPSTCAEKGEDPALPLKRWQSVVRRFRAIPAATLLNGSQFESQLELATKEGLTLFGNDAPQEELQAAVEMLRRFAVAERNKRLEELAGIIAKTELVGDGDAVWTILFDLVRKHRGSWDLFSNTKEGPESSLQFLWDSMVESGVDTTGRVLVSAPVALFLTVLTAAHAVVNDAQQPDAEIIRTRLDQLSSTLSRDTGAMAESVSTIEKRAIIRSILKDFDSSVLLSDASERVLRSLGVKKEYVDAVVNAGAAQKVFEQTLENKTAELAKLFRDPAQGGLLLYRSTTSVDDAQLKSLVQKTLSSHGFTHSDDIRTNPTRWATHYAAIASTLLKDARFCGVIQEAVRAELGTANQRGGGTRGHGIVSDEGYKELQSLKELRENFERRKQFRIGSLTDFLSSNEGVEVGVRFAQALGAPMSALRKLQREAEKVADTRRASRTDIALLTEGGFPDQVTAAVVAAHPSWVKAQVLEKNFVSPQTPLDVLSEEFLRAAVRIYLRLSYVPHAGAAMMARNTRRRIGPVGSSPHEHNIAVEVGMVERMDNLLQKRYDWQGWYQRMQDVHNRNVSVRLKLQDLRTLDAQGQPFFDMQSERRFRIVAKDRVGMGIVKLDSDKYEDQSDNYTFGAVKLSQLVADARKTMLGAEYVPTVEVKVRRPSGQSKMRYSTLDYDRVEQKSAELYKKYVDLKKKSFFVPPTDLWLDIKGLQVRKSAEVADAQGYTVDLFENMNQPTSEESTTPKPAGPGTN